MKITIIVIVSSIALLGALAITGKKSVRAEGHIKVPPEEVWAVLTNASSYRSWNPILVEADGQYIIGNQINYQMKMTESEPPSPVAPTVVQLVPGQLLNQFGGYHGLITFDHHWELIARDGGTDVIQHETYRGFYVWFWDPSNVEVLYQQAIDQLKLKLEGASQ